MAQHYPMHLKSKSVHILLLLLYNKKNSHRVKTRKDAENGHYCLIIPLLVQIFGEFDHLFGQLVGQCTTHAGNLWSVPSHTRTTLEHGLFFPIKRTNFMETASIQIYHVWTKKEDTAIQKHLSSLKLC